MTPTSPISAFNHPIFRAVWVATLLSNLGGLIQSVGASWLMLSIAPTADTVALVQASVALPILLLSLVAGAVADNLHRRRVMLAAQVFMLLISASLAITVWLGMISPWLLLTFTFLIGCGGAFNTPTWQASVGDMVPRSQLAAVVTSAHQRSGFRRHSRRHSGQKAQRRADPRRPELIGAQVIVALHEMMAELEAGALLTIDSNRTRLRVLPLQQCDPSE